MLSRTNVYVSDNKAALLDKDLVPATKSLAEKIDRKKSNTNTKMDKASMASLAGLPNHLINKTTTKLKAKTSQVNLLNVSNNATQPKAKDKSANLSSGISTNIYKRAMDRKPAKMLGCLKMP